MNDDENEAAARPRTGAPLGRRAVLKALGALGVGSEVFRRALAAQAQGAGKVSAEMIQQAEWIAGLELTDDERKETAAALSRSLGQFAALRKVDVAYDIPPALAFVPAPGLRPGARAERNQATPIEFVRAPVRPRRQRDTGVPARHRAGRPDPHQAGQLDRADAALPRAPAAVRSAPEVRRHAHRGACAAAGGKSRRRACGRRLSRPAARSALGGEGPDRLPGLSHHMGRAAIQGPRDRRDGDRRRAARGGGCRAGGQAFARRPRDGRPLVRRHDAQSVGPARRLERLVGRLGVGGGRRPGRVRARQRDPRQHRLPLPGLRRLGSAPDLRPREPRRLHVAGLVDGQDRPDRPFARGLRPGLRRHPRPRRPRPHRRRPPLHLAPPARAARDQGRLLSRPREATRPPPSATT